MKIIFERKHSENENISTFWFRTEQRLSFISGQFIELTIPHESPDQRGIKRYFTISSSPTDLPLISITTHISNQGSSFKHALQKLNPGANLHMSEPMGDFVLPKDIKRRLIFVAGGIGITPFASMISWLQSCKQQRDITFVYAVTIAQDMIFQPEFELYDMEQIVIVKEPAHEWNGNIGMLDAKRLMTLTKPSINDLIYLAGPEPMIEQLTNQFKAQNNSKFQLVTDYFPGYE